MGRYLDIARELRETLAETFDTFNTINPRVPSGAREENRDFNSTVNSAEMVKRFQNATPQSRRDPKVNSVKSAKSLLEDSAARLEALGVHVATWPDGRARLIRSLDDIPPAVDSGALLWNPSEMLAYVSTPEIEYRSLILRLKGIRQQ